MAFRTLWGFDPDELHRAQHYANEQFGSTEAAGDQDVEKMVNIPSDGSSQIDELYRIFLLK